VRIEDDTRSFWVFTHECGCTTSVLTDNSYDRKGAFWEMFGSIAKAEAAQARGVTAQFVDAPTYHRDFYPMIKEGHTCLS
jgi:hypothetical protein